MNKLVDKFDKSFQFIQVFFKSFLLYVYSLPKCPSLPLSERVDLFKIIGLYQLIHLRPSIPVLACVEFI